MAELRRRLPVESLPGPCGMGWLRVASECMPSLAPFLCFLQVYPHVRLDWLMLFNASVMHPQRVWASLSDVPSPSPPTTCLRRHVE